MSILEIELFKGERALVTGAASNIGRAIAVRLAGEGADVTITDIDKNRLSEVADAARQHALSITCCVTIVNPRLLNISI